VQWRGSSSAGRGLSWAEMLWLQLDFLLLWGGRSEPEVRAPPAHAPVVPSSTPAFVMAEHMWGVACTLRVGVCVMCYV